MYIEKYWGEYVGGTDDSLNLIAFLEDQNKEHIMKICRRWLLSAKISEKNYTIRNNIQ